MIYFLENYDDIIKFNIESIRPKYQIDGTHQNMQYTTCFYDFRALHNDILHSLLYFGRDLLDAIDFIKLRKHISNVYLYLCEYCL